MEIAGFVIVPIIVALVELAKRLGLSSKYSAILALVLGVGISIWDAGFVGLAVVLAGVVIGLSASGLYSGGKALMTK